MLTFNQRYFWLTIILFLIEVFIAVYINDRFVRPFLGDFLVVILIYFFVRTFFRLSVGKAAIAVLLFSYVVEITQYFNLITRIGLENSKVARAILGWSFSWLDILAYTLGILTVIFIENVLAKKELKNNTVVR